MATLNLGSKGLASNGWIRWVAVAVLVGVIGLGVKAIWFDQQRYLVPVSVIPEGSNLALEKWQSVPASLGVIGSRYLPATVRPRGFALETLFPGRLVQLTQLGSFAPESLSRVVVTNKTQLGSGIHPAASVQIWAAQRLLNNQFDAPKLLVRRATVSRIIKGAAMFGGQSQQAEVLIRPAQTAGVLAAMASDSAVFLVAEQ
ncbi:MAG: hypothetical protein RJA26_316 [Actinomycetota bacterium]|jgi:hypothetical protein